MEGELRVDLFGRLTLNERSLFHLFVILSRRRRTCFIWPTKGWSSW
jgi:hypothetical protein